MLIGLKLTCSNLNQINIIRKLLLFLFLFCLLQNRFVQLIISRVSIEGKLSMVLAISNLQSIAKTLSMRTQIIYGQAGLWRMDLTLGPGKRKGYCY